MASGCPHVKQLQLASDKSFLNPRSWACVECGFTDSVWACLLCNHVACGRNNSSHALKHFETTKHPIAVEINKRYVHCYLCDDYVLADNASGDIGLVQSLLAQVALQQYSESCSRSGRVIRPAQALLSRSKSRVEEASDNAADKRYTALCHWRFSQLARAFNTWRYYVQASKVQEVKGAPKQLGKRRKKLLTPGMTGFRNLGNTCYMNAVLQSLSHLLLFRECFRQLLPKTPPPTSSLTSPPMSPANLSRRNFLSHKLPNQIKYTRQTTMECFQHITTCPPSLLGRCGRATRRNRGTGGLNGGGGGGRQSRSSRKSTSDFLDSQENLCLSAEMHALMRVMWSGKWAVVTPHAVLNAVWELTPCFRGYTQHDAQEFLCELLLVLQTELDMWPHVPLYPDPSPLSHPVYPDQLLPSLFEGQLLSKITYGGCGHSSSSTETFWNLSLHFPENLQNERAAKNSAPVSLEEMLEQFTCPERLEGATYTCTVCPRANSQQASKQMMIAQCPEVLRIHLKRFGWSGRMQHKLNRHVSFPFQLDLKPFCAPPSSSESEGEEEVGVVNSFDADLCDFPYQLSSVIVHHGTGFQSGHYTAYCWNSEAESWVHCNDARLSRCTAKEVQNCQAYILFYTCLKDDSMNDSVFPPSKKRRTED